MLAPNVPLLFMGEEYGEQAPFLYFISHTDEALVAAVRAGRKAEFAAFKWKGEPHDPQSVETFRRCTLNWEGRTSGRQQTMLAFYASLIHLRKTTRALAELNKEKLEARVLSDTLLSLRRWADGNQVIALMNFADRPATVTADFPEGYWQRLLDSADEAWAGPGSVLMQVVPSGSQLILQPQSCAVFSQVVG